MRIAIILKERRDAIGSAVPARRASAGHEIESRLVRRLQRHGDIAIRFQKQGMSIT